MTTSSQATAARALPQPNTLARNAALVVAASLLVAFAAQVSFRVPFSPVPFTLQDLAVLLVGITLGSRLGAAALALYLAEGALGLPVFSPAAGPSGILHLLGPTGGYLLAYPLVAYLAGLRLSTLRHPLLRTLVPPTLAQSALYIGGASWLAFFIPHPLSLGLLPFLPRS